MTIEGEAEFDLNIELPQDLSDDFFEKFKGFLDEELNQIKSYFSQLLSFKRAAFSLEIAAPIRVLYEIEKYLDEYQYLTYNQVDLVEKGDENKDLYPQELFDEYPTEIMGATLLYVSLREEFIHLAELVENVPLSCDIHDDCSPRAALRGLLYGYDIKNIVGFIEQENHQ
jgi:hypothetical protein